MLQIGQLVRADRAMSADAINKHLPLKGATVPSTTVLVLGLAAIVVSIAAAAFLHLRPIPSFRGSFFAHLVQDPPRLPPVPTPRSIC